MGLTWGEYVKSLSNFYSNRAEIGNNVVSVEEAWGAVYAAGASLATNPISNPLLFSYEQLINYLREFISDFPKHPSHNDCNPCHQSAYLAAKAKESAKNQQEAVTENTAATSIGLAALELTSILTSIENIEVLVKKEAPAAIRFIIGVYDLREYFDTEKEAVGLVASAGSHDQLAAALAAEFILNQSFKAAVTEVINRMSAADPFNAWFGTAGLILALRQIKSTLATLSLEPLREQYSLLRDRSVDFNNSYNNYISVVTGSTYCLPQNPPPSIVHSPGSVVVHPGDNVSLTFSVYDVSPTALRLQI